MCVLFCQIPPDPYSNDLSPAEFQEIDTMCISPAEETLAISTDKGQLYSFNLSSVDMIKVKQSPIPAPPHTETTALSQQGASAEDSSKKTYSHVIQRKTSTPT